MKTSQLVEMTAEERQQRASEVKQELFNLRLQQSGGQLEKPSRIKELRREYARIQTIDNERR